MRSNTKIALFTLSFPYGKMEPFLEEEIKYLASNVSEVVIFPSSFADGNKRKLPSNVRVNTGLADLKVSILTILFWNLWNVVQIYFTSLFSKKWKCYLKYFKSFLHYLAKDLVKLKKLKKYIKKEGLEHAIFYDYWFVNSTLTLSVLRRKKLIKRLYCRTHGFDLYDSVQFEKAVSFREFKVANIDAVFTISQHGYQYLKSQIPKKYLGKVKKSYLGVDVDRKKLPESINQLIIVSCATVLSFKRVQLTFRVLNSLGIPLKWVHFGGGQFFESLEEEVKNTKLNIEVDLKGHTSNKEVLKFYQDNYVDYFISLSTNEGLPVSMMEAQGNGIPILAMDVNGVPEIVKTNTTGILIPLEASDQEISEILKVGIQDASFDRESIIEYFERNFSASRNYQKFTKELLQN